MDHYFGILAGYGAAIGAFWAIKLLALKTRLHGGKAVFERKWIEIAIVAISVVAVIGVGQLYVANMLLPDEGELFQSLNQLIIFAPLIAIVIWRGQPLQSAYLPANLAVPSLVFGGLLAAIALFAYCAMRGLLPELPGVLSSVFQTKNISFAAQVLLEDIAIAVLLSRLVNAIGVRWTVIIVACLFQIAHIPAFLANGATLASLQSLVLDTGIGLIIFGALISTRNIWWFWPIHTVMDLMQFYP